MTESNKTEAARVPTNRDRAFARQFALLGLYEWLVNPLSSPEALALIVPSLINQEDTEAGDRRLRNLITAIRSSSALC